MLDLKPQRILIIQVSRIGDTLFSTPAIRAVAQANPQAHITVLGHPNRAEVFENIAFIHQVGVIEKRRAKLKGWLSVKAYDLALVYGFDEELVAYALRVAHKVVAFRQSNESLNQQLFKAVEPPAFQSEHAVKQLMHLPASLGWGSDNLRLVFQPTPIELQAAKAILKARGVPEGSLVIGLQVASFPTKSYRDWPIEAFVALAQALKADYPSTHFLIYGGKAELERTQWLAKQLGTEATHLAGQLSLRQTAACMAQTQLYIGIDTGPTHMMSTFDIPMVLLYHCLSPAAMTGPLQHPACTVLDLPPTEQGCKEEQSLGEISVPEVKTACSVLLERYAKPELVTS